MGKIILAVVFFAAGLAGGYYLWGLNGVGEIEHALGKPIPLPQELLSTTQEAKGKPLSEADISKDILGVWQSVDDPTFTREFAVDASVIDTYSGNAPETQEGRWAIFTAPEGEPPPFPIAKGTRYLKISSVEEVLYFSVSALTSETLELAYLDGTGVQKFQRKK